MRILISFIFSFCFLNALAQYDTSKWNQLRQSIGDRSIVALGEEGHGYESINIAKSTTFDFLRRQMNFGAVVFESSFTESMIAYLRNGALEERMKSFLYPFWNTASVRNALRFAYESEQKTQEQLPAILGFDVQEDCRFTSFSSYLWSQGYVGISKMLLSECDSLLSLYIGKNPARKGAMLKEESELLITSYNVILKEANKKPLQDIPKKILMRCFENRKWLCEYLTLSDVYERLHFRDSIMASNVIWIKEELLSSKKILLWTADTHAAKKDKSKAIFMGERLQDYFKKEYYAISFRKGMGMPASRFDSIFTVKKLQKIKSSEWVTPCN